MYRYKSKLSDLLWQISYIAKDGSILLNSMDSDGTAIYKFLENVEELYDRYALVDIGKVA